MTKKWALAALVALGAMSCESRQSACNKEIEKCVEGFSDAYFNYDLAKALEFCTPESRKWIEFLASNIGEADLEVLNAQEKRAQAEVKDIRGGGLFANGHHRTYNEAGGRKHSHFGLCLQRQQM